MNRRNLFLPDAMWEAIQKAAEREGMKRGTPVSAAAWIREAIQQRLQREAEG